MDQGKLALLADKTMDFLMLLALVALVCMAILEGVLDCDPEDLKFYNGED